MNEAHGQTKKALLLSLMMLGLAACGASKNAPSGSTDLASRAPIDVVAQNPNTAWAYCNEGVSKALGFKATMMAYIDNNQIRNDLMYLKLASLPAGFGNGDLYLQMFRWQANTSGAAYMDPTPLKFRLMRQAGGAEILAHRDYLRWSEISTAASQMNVGVEDFFKHTFIIVDTKDPLGQFDAFRVVAYRKSDNKSAGEVDVLMPVFHADPVAYDTENGAPRSTLLTALHPFKDKRNQGWGANDYQTWADAMCNAFD